MTYDHEVSLIDKTYTDDDIGNQMANETLTTILCKKTSVKRSEFYQAATSNLKPELVLVVHNYEYNGQTEIEFYGLRYNVIRTYEIDFEEIEIICERVLSNG
jgi:SPP1 family predicted phage head-tail adaptor